jgi:hypothetical protein
VVVQPLQRPDRTQEIAPAPGPGMCIAICIEECAWPLNIEGVA